MVLNTFNPGALVLAVAFILSSRFVVDCEESKQNEIAKKQPESAPLHAVIIDAGSTGTRVLAVAFTKSAGCLQFLNDCYREEKPGLSSYANNPEEGVASIARLLDVAKGFVPEEYWSTTPLAMKATAGLRLLSPEKANGLLDKVKKLFEQYPFKTTENSVVIMNGVDEGIYSWFTINFYLDLLNSKFQNTVAALDLGGGSIQVTFVPTNDKLVNQEFITKYKMMDQEVKLYSHSYLGLGIMVARESILTANNGGGLNVTSPCVHEAAKGLQYSYGSNTYNVTGAVSANSPAIDYQKCKSIIETVVNDVAIDKPKDLLDQIIVVFSYFFDRAKDAGLVGDAGGELKVESFYKEAEIECAEVNYDESRAYICLDLIYMAVLLEKGFGLPLDTVVTIMDKIGGHEISWALGAAYHVLEFGIK